MREDEDGGGGEIGCVVGLAVAPGRVACVALGEFGGRGAGWEGGREAEANKRKIFPEDYTDIFVGFIGFGTLRLG